MNRKFVNYELMSKHEQGSPHVRGYLTFDDLRSMFDEELVVALQHGKDPLDPVAKELLARLDRLWKLIHGELLSAGCHSLGAPLPPIYAKMAALGMISGV